MNGGEASVEVLLLIDQFDILPQRNYVIYHLLDLNIHLKLPLLLLILHFTHANAEVHFIAPQQQGTFGEAGGQFNFEGLEYMYLLLVNGQLIFLFEGGEIAFVEDNPLDEGRQMGYTFGHAFQQFIDLCFRDVLGTRYLMMLW